MNSVREHIEKELQFCLTKGWKDFLNGNHYKSHKEFADFLDSSDEFQNKHRKRLPHPPHEFAARFMGIPVTQKLVSWGLQTNHWFPGDFYASKEVHKSSDEVGEEGVHARVFTLLLLFDYGRQKFCELTFEFPHRHDRFGFLEPKVRVNKVYQNDKDILARYLSEELLHVN